MYGHGGHVGHMNKTMARMLHMTFGYNWPSGFRGEVI